MRSTTGPSPRARASLAALLFGAAALLLVRASRAADAPPRPPRALVVVAYPGATDAAWSLARAVYADASLLPDRLDEATARVLCGEPAVPSAGPHDSVAELAEAVAALRGEDAPSRMLLGEIARRLSVRAVVAVHLVDGRPVARVYLPETGTFDAATYAPEGGAAAEWGGAVRSLERSYSGAPPAAQATVVPGDTPGKATSAPGAVPGAARPAPGLATHDVRERRREQPSETPRPFYQSAWFWGALGAAVLLGGGAYLATRDTAPSTIHLELRVP